MKFINFIKAIFYINITLLSSLLAMEDNVCEPGSYTICYNQKVVHKLFNNVHFTENDWRTVDKLPYLPDGSQRKLFEILIPKNSLTIEQIYQNPSLLTQLKSATQVTNTIAYFSLPEGNQPCPGVILLHGSEGISDGMKNYAKLLRKNGIASLCVNRFTGMKDKNGNPSFDTFSDQFRISPQYELLIAFHSGKLLQSHPRLKGQKISVMGGSRGGIVAWDCANEENIENFSNNFQFSAHVIYYGMPIIQKPCVYKAPLLFLHGKEDDLTPYQNMKEYLESLKGSHQSFKTHHPLGETITGNLPNNISYEAHYYNNAGHAFDGKLGETISWKKLAYLYFSSWYKNPSQHYISDAQNLSKANIKIVENGFIPVDNLQEKPRPIHEIPIYIKSKEFSGATLHLNSDAAQHAWEQTLRFLKENLSP